MDKLISRKKLIRNLRPSWLIHKNNLLCIFALPVCGSLTVGICYYMFLINLISWFKLAEYKPFQQMIQSTKEVFLYKIFYLWIENTKLKGGQICGEKSRRRRQRGEAETSKMLVHFIRPIWGHTTTIWLLFHRTEHNLLIFIIL